jgi:hypothetical protein
VNANDLADRLEQFYSGSHIQKAAEVLRQQQTEIETLKSDMRMLLKEYYEYCVKKK